MPRLSTTTHRRNARTKRRGDLVTEVRKHAALLESTSSHELEQRANNLRTRIADGTPPDDDSILVPAFALVYESLRRAHGVCFYDVQILAGLSLARGRVAEVQTGEGKTFIAALPAFLYSLAGRGAHVVTCNAYLAERDCKLLRPVYERLGVDVALLPEQAGPAQKRDAYRADVTYGVGYEFGFDYLRDQVRLRNANHKLLGRRTIETLTHGRDENLQPIQRRPAFALVDEIDSVLIDDAGSPLVISEASLAEAPDADVHLAARETIARLEPGPDYRVNPAAGVCELTDAGASKIHERLDALPLDQLLRPWAEYVRHALKAEHLLRRDVHYVVVNNDAGAPTVRIVDQSTGRIFDSRTWQDGLHQAVEGLEGVKITAEATALARITRQSFFQRYDRLCGMTGTAVGAEREFREFYHLEVDAIPLHRPSRRTSHPDRYFADRAAKWNAVCAEVREMHERGRPVLVGTRTIADSEELRDVLTGAGLPHTLLNGRQDAEEADVVSRAGERGAITIATNMAGRGTDIRLEEEVIELGGLHVVGTERHDSNRVDRQLVGRSARQGEPGSARFFISAADALIAGYSPQLAEIMKRSTGQSGEVDTDLNRRIRKAQQRAARADFSRRRELYRQDRQSDQTRSRFAGVDGG